MKIDYRNIASNAAMIGRRMTEGDNGVTIDSIDHIVNAATILNKIEKEDPEIYERSLGLWDETCCFIAERFSKIEQNDVELDLSEKEIRKMMESYKF